MSTIITTTQAMSDPHAWQDLSNAARYVDNIGTR